MLEGLIGKAAARKVGAYFNGEATEPVDEGLSNVDNAL